MGTNKNDHPIPLDRLQDPRELPFAVGRSRGELHHLHKSGCTYFVTFCLFGKNPTGTMQQPRLDQESTPEEIAARSEPPDDSSTLLLALPPIARVVEEVLLFFQGRRYGLHSWCIMPDHVHCLVTPYEGSDLSKVLHSWKSFSALEINRKLHRTGPVWERETFNHIIRTAESYSRSFSYIERNPVTSGLCHQPHEWPFSSARFRFDHLIK